MEQTRLQELKDRAFHSKSQDDWNNIMQEIKEAVNGDNGAAQYLRKYCLTILPKKKEWWDKTKNKPQFNAKPKMMFSDETDKAIGELARTLTAYLNNKQ